MATKKPPSRFLTWQRLNALLLVLLDGIDLPFTRWFNQTGANWFVATGAWPVLVGIAYGIFGHRPPDQLAYSMLAVIIVLEVVSFAIGIEMLARIGPRLPTSCCTESGGSLASI